MLEVKPTVWLPEMAKMARKPMAAPVQKHLPDGCNINMPPSNCHQWGHIVLPYNTLLFLLMS